MPQWSRKVGELSRLKEHHGYFQVTVRQDRFLRYSEGFSKHKLRPLRPFAISGLFVQADLTRKTLVSRPLLLLRSGVTFFP